VDYRGLSKRLELPAGWTAPTELTFGDVRVIAPMRVQLNDDVAGINASLDLIRQTRGSSRHGARDQYSPPVVSSASGLGP
jgi:hypothetical protein